MQMTETIFREDLIFCWEEYIQTIEYLLEIYRDFVQFFK